MVKEALERFTKLFTMSIRSNMLSKLLDYTYLKQRMLILSVRSTNTECIENCKLPHESLQKILYAISTVGLKNSMKMKRKVSLIIGSNTIKAVKERNRGNKEAKWIS